MLGNYNRDINTSVTVTLLVTSAHSASLQHGDLHPSKYCFPFYHRRLFRVMALGPLQVLCVYTVCICVRMCVYSVCMYMCTNACMYACVLCVYVFARTYFPLTCQPCGL